MSPLLHVSLLSPWRSLMHVHRSQSALATDSLHPSLYSENLMRDLHFTFYIMKLYIQMSSVSIDAARNYTRITSSQPYLYLHWLWSCTNNMLTCYRVATCCTCVFVELLLSLKRSISWPGWSCGAKWNTAYYKAHGYGSQLSSATCTKTRQRGILQQIYKNKIAKVLATKVQKQVSYISCDNKWEA